MKHHLFRNTSILAILLICLIGFTACPPPNPPPETKPDPVYPTDPITEVPTGPDDNDTVVPEWDPNFIIMNRIELPAVDITKMFVQHGYYAMEYDTAQRHSVWVAYKFYDDYNKKNCNRSDAWNFDPIIPKEYQSLNSKSQTYFYAGYDRGHLCASEDRVFSLDANKETFYYSNMSPQLSWFNQNIWLSLENLVRDWAQASDCDTLYVVTGGAINPGVETFGKLIDRNNVTIPKYYFKALVKRQGDTFDGIAFLLENKKYDSKKITHEYSMTIRELEELTNINFFPYLRYVLDGKPWLEDSVEMRLDKGKWPL
jgi:endonuclease G